MMRIDKKTYKVSEVNFYKEEHEKRQIIIGLSLRKENYHIVRLKHKHIGLNKRWNTFTVNRNGKIFQHYDPKYYTNFLKFKAADKKSISIVLENMGGLFKTPDNVFINWLNEECDPERVIEKKWLGNKYWEIINENQLKNVVELCSYVCEKYKIKKRCVDFHHYHDDITDFDGIVLTSNYQNNSNEINPFLDVNKINQLLNE